MSVTSDSRVASPSSGEVRGIAESADGGLRARRAAVRTRLLYPAVVVFAVVVAALLWTGVAGVVSADRERTIAAAYKENENLARAFDEHIVSIMSGLDQLVQLIRLQYEQKGDKLDLAALFKDVHAPESVVQIAIIDENGFVANSSLPFTRVNLSDREHYRVHRDIDSGKLFVSKPVLGRVSGKWSLQLTRRINRRDGSFGGVVVLSLDPYYFARFYRQVDLGRGGLVSFVGLDGVVRARQAGDVFTLGQNVQRSALFEQIATGNNGSYFARSDLDRVRRYVSYRIMQDYPFAVVVGTSEQEVLGRYYKRRKSLFGAAGVATILLLLGTYWLAMLAKSQARYAAELEDSRARQQAFMDGVPDVAWVKDRGGRFVAVNRAFAARFGVDGDSIIGETDVRIFGAERAQQFRDEDAHVMKTGESLRFEAQADVDGETRWLETIKVPIYDAHRVLRGTCGVSRDITERKRAEEALVESERRLKLALDAADLAMFDWNIATGQVFITERWSTFLGEAPRPTETTIDALSAMVHPEDMRQLTVRIAAALKRADGLYRAEHRVRRPDGGWTWIESNGSVVARDAQGRALRILGINSDITKRKYTENALRSSEERFRNLTSLSSDWYWEQDEHFRFTAFSEGFAKRTDMHEADYLGRARWEIPYAGMTEEQWVEHRAMLERHEPFYDFETTRLARDGETIYWSLSGRPVFDTAGRFSGYQGIGRDITQRKAAELALRDAHAFLDSIIENIPDVVFVRDAKELRCMRVNRAAEAFMGVRREDVIGMRDADLFPPDQAEIFARSDREALAAGKLVEIAEEQVPTRSHGVRCVTTKKIPIMDADGAPRYLLGIVADITERKQAEAAMREMNRMLEERAAELTAANRELEAYSYTVSHDLRAPLRHINGFMKLLRQRLGEQVDLQTLRLFEKVTGAAQHMNQLIDDLLTFSRMSRMTLRSDLVSLDRVVAELRDDLKPDYLERRVEWRVGHLPEVRGDGSLLRLAFQNLLGNAVKYTGNSSQAVIEVGNLGETAGEVILFVRDNGVGFDMKYADRLFGVFQRLHAAHEFEGTGIGLATVKRIVERHGGRVWAEAERGRGATFFVALPSSITTMPAADAA